MALVAQLVDFHLQCRRPGFHPWVGKIPLEKEMATQLPVFWPGEFHGVYSLEGCKELDTTEQLSGGLVVESLC